MKFRKYIYSKVNSTKISDAELRRMILVLRKLSENSTGGVETQPLGRAFKYDVNLGMRRAFGFLEDTFTDKYLKEREFFIKKRILGPAARSAERIKKKHGKDFFKKRYDSKGFAKDSFKIYRYASDGFNFFQNEYYFDWDDFNQSSFKNIKTNGFNYGFHTFEGYSEFVGPSHFRGKGGIGKHTSAGRFSKMFMMGGLSSDFIYKKLWPVGFFGWAGSGWETAKTTFQEYLKPRPVKINVRELLHVVRPHVWKLELPYFQRGVEPTDVWNIFISPHAGGGCTAEECFKSELKDLRRSGKYDGKKGDLVPLMLPFAEQLIRDIMAGRIHYVPGMYDVLGREKPFDYDSKDDRVLKGIKYGCSETKTRVVWRTDLLQMLVSATVLQRLGDNCRVNSSTSDIKIGFGFSSQKFLDLAYRMKDVNRLAAFDAKLFDCTLSKEVIKASYAIIRGCYPSGIEHDRLIAYTFNSLVDSLICTPEGGVFRVIGANKSGDPATSVINSIASAIMWYYTIEKCEFFNGINSRDIKIVVGGDDGNIGIRNGDRLDGRDVNVLKAFMMENFNYNLGKFSGFVIYDSNGDPSNVTYPDFYKHRYTFNGCEFLGEEKWFKLLAPVQTIKKNKKDQIDELLNLISNKIDRDRTVGAIDSICSLLPTVNVEERWSLATFFCLFRYYYFLTDEEKEDLYYYYLVNFGRHRLGRDKRDDVLNFFSNFLCIERTDLDQEIISYYKGAESTYTELFLKDQNIKDFGALEMENQRVDRQEAWRLSLSAIDYYSKEQLLVIHNKVSKYYNINVNKGYVDFLKVESSAEP